MTHFGIMSPWTPGHLYPLFALSHELQKRGHQLTLFGPLDVEAHAVAAGLGFCALGLSHYHNGYVPKFLKRMGQMNGLSVLRLCIKEQCQEADTILHEAPKAMKKEGIEALLIDQIMLSGETVATILDIPFITICNALMINRENNAPPYFTHWDYSLGWAASIRNHLGYAFLYQMAQPIRKVVNKHRQQWKLPTYTYSSEPYSKLLQLSQQPAEFEFPRQDLPQCFQFTGPYVARFSRKPVSFPFDKLTEKPLIYASLGTIQNRLKWIFKVIAEACAGINVQLVISLGGSGSPETFAKLPGNPIVVKYAPQLELLHKTALTITHAGLNTTLESLSNGVPMVAIPITNDQPGVAARIAWTKTGEVVTLSRLSVPRLRHAIQEVLTEDSYRKNALRLQKAICRAGGIKQAASLIERVISTNRPTESVNSSSKQTSSYGSDRNIIE